MNKIAKKILLSSMALIMITLLIPFQFLYFPQTVFATEQVRTTIQDISAKELATGSLSAATKTKDNEYIRNYNLAVGYYNEAQYSKAIPLLKKLANQYNDGKSSLYLWELCMAGDLSNRADYASAIAYYKAALCIRKETFVEHNVVYCYMQRAEQLKRSDRVVMLLYGYQFISKRNLRDDSLGTLAVNLCNDLLTPPLYDWFDPAMECIRAALIQEDDPYLHQSLGLIYLYQNNRSLAKAEFKEVLDHYPRSQFYATCLERYNNIGNASYRYQGIYPVKVTADYRTVASLTAKIMLQIPQTYYYQTVKNLKVTFNNQTISYKTVMDRFGTQFLSLEIPKVFRVGINRLVVESQVDVAEKRFSKDSIARIKIADYHQNEVKYKLLTQSTEAIDLKNPQIQKMVAEIRQSARSEQLVDQVEAVYQYVMGAMSYQDNAGTHQKVGVKRALQHIQSAVCEDYAIITVALLRSLKIPASYFSGDCYGSPVGHAWAVFYTPDFQPIPLDTTWGDTGKIPDLVFLATANSTITTNFSCDSNLMPENTSIHFECNSDPGVVVELGEEQLKLEKQSE
jgi:hypothetical protein